MHLKRQTHAWRSSYKPYLTLFHADISLAFSLSISSGSTFASLLWSCVCCGRRLELPCRSRDCCRRLSTISSCITPPTYCTALGETEFMSLSPQSCTLVILIATQNWREIQTRKPEDEVNDWLMTRVYFLSMRQIRKINFHIFMHCTLTYF